MGAPNKTPFKICALADGAQEIRIYGDIGDSWWGDSITAAQFVRDLAALDATTITVRLNSFGGSVVDGIAIHNALKRHPATINVAIDGVAASIASLIAMAGDTLEIADNAQLMIHAPWGGVSGNSAALREYADMLDGWSESMAVSYANKTGKDKAEVLALLTDGVDHWFTAEQALAAGWVDSIATTAELAVEASVDFSGLSRFTLPVALADRFHIQVTPTKPAAAAVKPQEHSMATPEELAAAQAAAETKIRAEALQADQARRQGIRAAFAKFDKVEGAAALRTTCEDDTAITPQAAGEKLLALLAKGAEPAGSHHVVVAESGVERFRAEATQAILARVGARDEKGSIIVASSANSCRGMTLLDMARVSLQASGFKTDGMDKMQLVAAAFTQSGSDFPVLLENIMHKTLQGAYALAPDTWSRFCSVGTVSDFRAHSRYRTGSLGNLDATNELGEFKNKSIPDGEKASISVGTKGNIINLSRQAIINDDLGAFVGLAAMLGRAAKRTIEAEVYAYLASNPLLADGIALFHASHGNLGTGGVPSVAAFEEARVLMAKQKDVGGNDFLDLRPSIWLGGMGIGGDARVLNGAEYDPDTANKLQKPNKVRGLFADLVDTPRIAGTEWYSFASPADAPVLEVAFLDGQREPFLEVENGFTVDGARYKVRLDYGIAAIDYRGAVKNVGA